MGWNSRHFPPRLLGIQCCTLLVRRRFVSLQNMSPATLIGDLETKWQATCQEVGVSEEKASKWFATLRDHYCEDGRYYHTLNHIKEMLGWAERYSSELQSLATVSLATWFHEYVYVFSGLISMLF